MTETTRYETIRDGDGRTPAGESQLKASARSAVIDAFNRFLFLVTGAYMFTSFPDLYRSDEGVRMMYRSTHIYLLFSSLLNLVVGLHPPTGETPSARALQRTARVALGVAPALFLVAFLYEPARYAIERPISYWAVLVCFGAVLLLLVARYGPWWQRFFRRKSRPVLRASFRLVSTQDDLARCHEIRRAAFQPIFDSFRKLLGDEVYKLAQAHEDEAQGDLLESMLSEASPWSVWVAELNNQGIPSTGVSVVVLRTIAKAVIRNSPFHVKRRAHRVKTDG